MIARAGRGRPPDRARHRPARKPRASSAATSPTWRRASSRCARRSSWPSACPGLTVEDVWASYGAGGLVSDVANVEVELGGHPVEQADIDELLSAGKEAIDRNGQVVLHAHPGALHDRPRAGRAAADRPPRQPARRRHPRHRRRPVAAAQHRHGHPLGASRREGDRRLADRGCARLPQRRGARAWRRAGRAGRGGHQRLASTSAGCSSACARSRSVRATSPTTSPPPSRSSAATPSG